MPSEISLYFYYFEAIAMRTLAKQVLDHATGLPEGTPLVAKEVASVRSRLPTWMAQEVSTLMTHG